MEHRLNCGSEPTIIAATATHEAEFNKHIRERLGRRHGRRSEA